jgi:hypothetical protein
MEADGGGWQTLRCAKCGRTERKLVVFGYPSPELLERARRGELVLGGCEIPGPTPTWWCDACEPSLEEIMEGSPAGTRGAEVTADRDRRARHPWTRRLTWLFASLSLLVGGFLGFVAAVVVVSTGRAGGEVTEIPTPLWRAVATGILAQALLPTWLLAAALWLALLRWAPGLDTGWRTLLPGTLLAALAAFPPVAALGFEMWEPTNAGDYLATWLAVSGGVAVALLLPRLAPGWRPGELAVPARGGGEG